VVIDESGKANIGSPKVVVVQPTVTLSDLTGEDGGGVDCSCDLTGEPRGDPRGVAPFLAMVMVALVARVMARRRAG